LGAALRLCVSMADCVQVTLAQMGGNRLRIQANRVHDSNGGNDAGETSGGYAVLVAEPRKCSDNKVHLFSMSMSAKMNRR